VNPDAFIERCANTVPARRMTVPAILFPRCAESLGELSKDNPEGSETVRRNTGTAIIVVVTFALLALGSPTQASHRPASMEPSFPNSPAYSSVCHHSPAYLACVLKQELVRSLDSQSPHTRGEWGVKRGKRPENKRPEELWDANGNVIGWLCRNRFGELEPFFIEEDPEQWPEPGFGRP